MSSKAGIIFDNLTIFWCQFFKKMERQKIFWTGNEVCDIIYNAETPLSGLAVNIVAMLSTWK